MFDRYGYGYADCVRSGGPERVVTNEPDPDFKPRPIGFTAVFEEEQEDEKSTYRGRHTKTSD